MRKCCEQDSQGRACTKKRRGIFQADTCSTQADANSIQALPADILLHIFAFTHPKAQREVLPLVCRQWQEVLQGPVALWRHLELDFPAAMDLGLDGSSLAPSRSFQVSLSDPHDFSAYLLFANNVYTCLSSVIPSNQSLLYIATAKTNLHTVRLTHLLYIVTMSTCLLAQGPCMSTTLHSHCIVRGQPLHKHGISTA